MTRTLSLKREHLAELSTAELGVVHGAAVPTGEGRCPTLPLDCVLRLTELLIQDTFTCPRPTWLCR